MVVTEILIDAAGQHGRSAALERSLVEYRGNRPHATIESTPLKRGSVKSNSIRRTTTLIGQTWQTWMSPIGPTAVDYSGVVKAKTEANTGLGILAEIPTALSSKIACHLETVGDHNAPRG